MSRSPTIGVARLAEYAADPRSALTRDGRPRSARAAAVGQRAHARLGRPAVGPVLVAIAAALLLLGYARWGLDPGAWFAGVRGLLSWLLD